MRGRRGGRRWLIPALILLGLSLLSASAWAQGSGREVIDLLPSSVNRASAVTALRKTLGQPITLTDVPLPLLETLRWSKTDINRAACLKRAPEVAKEIEMLLEVPLPGEPEELFATLLEQAKRQLLFLETEAASRSLSQAKEMAPCLREVQTPDTMFVLATLEGAISLEAGDGRHERAFLLAASLFPQPGKGDAALAPAARQELERARKTLEALPRTVGQGATLEGETYLDGVPLSQRSTRVPGAHLAQIRSASKEVRTVWLEGDDSLIFPPPTAFGLLTTLEAREGLAKELLEEDMGASWIAALNTYMASSGDTLLLFAVGTEPVLRTYTRGGRVGSTLPKPSVVQRPGLSSGPVRPLEGLRVGATGEVRALLGSPTAFDANGRSAALGLEAQWWSQKRVLTLQVALFQTGEGDGAEAGGCSLPDSGTPDEASLACAVESLPSSPGITLGVGAGYRLAFGPFQGVATGGLEATHLPNTLVELPETLSELGSYGVVDAWLYGPSLEGRVLYPFYTESIIWSLELSIKGGVWLGGIDGVRMTAFPLAMTLGAGANF